MQVKHEQCGLAFPPSQQRHRDAVKVPVMMLIRWLQMVVLAGSCASLAMPVQEPETALTIEQQADTE